MKLAAHYSKASIIISVSVLIISGFVYYLIINHIARQQLDGDLSEEMAEVIDYVNTNHRLPKQVEFDEDITTFAKTNLTHFETRFCDEPYFNAKEKETEAGRSIKGLITSNGQNYIVTIVESRENAEYLITIISIVTTILTAILLLILIITNTYVLNGLWKPFYHILNQVKKFNVADTAKLDVIEGNVDEFQDLNDAMVKMSSRVSSDYQGLKIFTENASHEMMTPLAVITSKLDILIQDDKLNSEQLDQITDIYSATGKLARLNQSLLLLVKIDNHLLSDTELINVMSAITEKAQQFQELIQSKKIELELFLNGLEITANKYLIDVLINNLFSNAIRHNKPNGIIRIIIQNQQLLFQNTGEHGPLNTDEIFERFYKGKTSEGTGLGLSIMNTICKEYNFRIDYQYLNEMHSFTIAF